MRVLITGAGGFIGSHLTERLIADGYEVTAMANYCGRDTFGWLDEVDGCERSRCDVRDPGQVWRMVRGHDRVYHLAALGSVPHSFEAPRSFVETNTLGTLNVALACAEFGAELVHTSTSEVYGTALTVLQNERHPLNPRSPYAASKISADKMVEALCRSNGLRAVILRPFNTYGPRQSARAVIPRIILSVLEKDGYTTRLGSLTAQRDWMHISDTIDAFMAVQPGVECKVFNAGTGISSSVGEIAELARKLTNSHKAVVEEAYRLRPSLAEVLCLRADAAALTAVTGWKPKVSMREGISTTIEWYRDRAIKPVEGFV
jgi:UDP-glucose 4-epimerase